MSCDHLLLLQRHARRLSVPCTVAMLVAILLCGCVSPRTGGPLRAVSVNQDPVELRANFNESFYMENDGSIASFLLSDTPIEQLMAGEVERAQVLHVELLWSPRPGATPLSSSATNATLRYLVFVDGEVGIYGGTAFIRHNRSIGSRRMSVSIAQGTIRLLESTPGFVDRLSPGTFSGSFTTERDERSAARLRYAANQIATNAIGRPRYLGMR